MPEAQPQAPARVKPGQGAGAHAARAQQQPAQAENREQQGGAEQVVIGFFDKNLLCALFNAGAGQF